VRLGALVLAVTASRAAWAEAPAVDPEDLPPLPVDNAEVSSAATLLAATTAEEEIVVGAAKREQSLGTVASAVTVVSADRIRRFGYRTIAEAISGVAGVFIEDNRLSSVVGIRGLNVPGAFNSRILVLVDGATVNEAWAAFGGVGFDGLVSIDDVARIEVIRGPVGALYGTNAFFGIINIVTRGAAEAKRTWGRIALNSIHGGVATAGFGLGGVDRQVRGSVLAMNRIGDAPTVPELGDELAGDGASTFAAALSSSYNGAFVQVRAYRSRRDSPFAPYDAELDLDPSYSLYNRQLLVEGGYTRELGKRLTVAARGYLNRYRYEDRILTSGDQFRDVGDATTIGAEVRGRYDLVPGKLGVTAGAEANLNRTESRAFFVGREAEGVTVPLDFHIEGLYAEVDGQPTPWLGFTGGLRFDSNSAFDRRLSPRGAVFLSRPERYGAKLLYAEGFRNPSAFEGYFADDVDFAANTAIASETIRSYEAVLWAKPVPGLATRLSTFVWDARDVIEQQPDPANPELLQFQNVGRYVSQGVEAEASYRDSRGWYGFGGVTFARIGTGTDEVDYGGVVDAPALVVSGGVSTPRLWNAFHISTEVHVMGERRTRPRDDGMPSPPSPRWTGVNVTVHVPDVRGFDVTAGVRNAGGRRNLIPAPGDYDRFPDGMPAVVVPRVPEEGREVFVKVGYSR
jgi:outer membrane receptor protein involved in Fe transport